MYVFSAAYVPTINGGTWFTHLFLNLSAAWTVQGTRLFYSLTAWVSNNGL
jgi:hypothetical protein